MPTQLIRHAGELKRSFLHDALILIRNGTFYNEHPDTSNAVTQTNVPLFNNLSFSLRSTPRSRIGKYDTEKHAWAVIGANPSPFLKVLKGDYIAAPPGSRTYPYLASDEIAKTDPRLRVLSEAVQYVGFGNAISNGAGGSGRMQGAYLSARYESRREVTDWTLLQYLKGETELNPSEASGDKSWDQRLFKRITKNLRLDQLLNMPVSNLSNGQTRRSKIAKALMNKPECLLLDEPFMGLDPPTLTLLSPMLKDLHGRSTPNIVLGLRPQDPIPDWITHVVVLGENNTVIVQGDVVEALYSICSWAKVERGEDQDPMHMRAAEALRKTYGPPPFERPTILDKDGIRRSDLSSIRQSSQNAVEERQSERELSKSLRSRQRHARQAALQKPVHERTATEWLTLMSPVSRSLYSDLRNSLWRRDQKQTVDRHEQIEATIATADSTSSEATAREPLIELKSIVVRYGDKVVLGHPPPQPGHTEAGLNLTISQGTRLLLLGPNGSGKTTLLSLLTSDHPHSYSLPIKFFGRTRLPEPGKLGLSLFEIQSRIGHSSPEVHAFFPRNMTIRRVLESAWAETFSSKPALKPENSALVDHFLRIWKPELCQTPDKADGSLAWASDNENHPVFARLPFGTQRLLLLLRAIIKQPDIIILDEAFSGLTSAIREKALKFLEHGDTSLSADTAQGDIIFPGLTEQQALVVVSHVKEEIPDAVDEYIRLPSVEEASEGKTVEMGRTKRGWVKTDEGWNAVWALRNNVAST